jgi:ribonuclease III
MLNIIKFEKDIKFKFKNKSLIVSALTHKSANHKINNEKLEFLGDRVIGLALSKKLFDLYPNETEGILDKRFASLVNRRTCCDVALSMNIQNHIITGNIKKRITKEDGKILSDSCEAVIGAIYIDRGYEVVKNYILKIWKKHIDRSSVTILDPKTKLQEYSLKKYKKLPHYRVINFTGPKHNPIYKIAVSIIGTKDYIGTGNSKQLAQLDGAAKLLKSINIK